MPAIDFINTESTCEISPKSPQTIEPKFNSEKSVSKSEFQKLIIKLIENAEFHGMDVYDFGKEINISGNILKGWASGELSPLPRTRKIKFIILSNINFDSSPIRTPNPPYYYAL